ncbi:MAG TPA: hypothetical protein VNA20_15790 [Frankiaceae bacterium]|nr:hypothetical protein [Frankiaceae bacterium]
MRVRTNLTAAAALAAAAFGSAPPASAATAGTIQMAITIGCYGCGTYGPDGNSISVTCTGVCNLGGVTCTGVCSYSGGGTADVPVGLTCLLEGRMTGDIYTAGGPVSFALSFVAPYWVMTLEGATAAGAYAITSPVGLVCDSAVTLTFAGTIAGTA